MVIDGKRLQGEKPTDWPFKSNFQQKAFLKRVQWEKGDWLKRIQGEKLIDWPDAGSVQVCRRVARWCRSRMKSFHSSRILWCYDDDDDEEEEEEEEEGKEEHGKYV